jgi:hypothetical protein
MCEEQNHVCQYDGGLKRCPGSLVMLARINIKAVTTNGSQITKKHCQSSLRELEECLHYNGGAGVKQDRSSCSRGKKEMAFSINRSLK